MSSHFENRFDIPRFQLSYMALASVTLILGKRFSGKSLLMMDVLYHRRNDINKGLIISGTEHASPFYEQAFPSIYISQKYEPAKVEKLLASQAKKCKQQHRITGSKDATAKSTVFMLMDDCLADNQWRNDETLKEIFFNGRHYHLNFYLTTQYPMAVPAQFRNNADYTFIYSDKDVKVRHKIYENYCGIIPSYEIFAELMDEVCTDYRCLVLDNRRRDKANWRDVIFWYKADTHESFRFGNDAFWEYDERYKLDSDAEDDDEYLRSVVHRYGDKEKPRMKIVMIGAS